MHQYTVAVTETNNVLDSVRAARQITDTHANSKAAVLGWSQGGGAAAFVAQNYKAYTVPNQ